MPVTDSRSFAAIAGSVNVFGGLHVWTADTQTAQERADWSRKLDAMAALQPSIVVPGHMLPGQKQDASQIAYTRAYLGALRDRAREGTERRRADRLDESGIP